MIVAMGMVPVLRNMWIFIHENPCIARGFGVREDLSRTFKNFFLSLSSGKIFQRSILRIITWWRAPGTSIRGLLVWCRVSMTLLERKVQISRASPMAPSFMVHLIKYALYVYIAHILSVIRLSTLPFFSCISRQYAPKSRKLSRILFAYT